MNIQLEHCADCKIKYKYQGTLKLNLGLWPNWTRPALSCKFSDPTRPAGRVKSRATLLWSVAVYTMRRQSSRIVAFLQVLWAQICLSCTEPGVARSSFWPFPDGGYLNSCCESSVMIHALKVYLHMESQTLTNGISIELHRAGKDPVDSNHDTL